MADIEFTAYADDCLFHAHLDLPEGARLTDHLNELDKVALTDVQLLALEDGHLVRQESLALDVYDIFAVEAPASSAPTTSADPHSNLARGGRARPLPRPGPSAWTDQR